MARARKRDYLFKKAGSQFWRIRLQHNGKSREMSLGTTDRLEAEAKALPLIAEHKRMLIENRPRLQTGFYHPYEPGRTYRQEDGGTIVATETDLIYLGADGAFLRQESNRLPQSMVINSRLTDATLSWARVDKERASLDRPQVATKSGDDEFIETYIKVNKFEGRYAETETRNVWAIFKSLTGDKPLKDCTRTEGRALAQYFKDHGDKSATVKKKVGRICAAVNLAIKDGHLTFNPFAGVAVLGDDAQQRLPLTDEDMAVCFANLDKLSDADALTFRILAATGMRLGEVYEIDCEHVEEKTRYVIVGTKTKQSKRRVPLPASLMRHLPAKITAPLFAGDSNLASLRLNKWLNQIGIDEPGKVMHSLRHRAQDRMRAVGCPPEIREELFGREKATVAAGYGKGHPVTVLKQWIDKILPVGRLTTPAKSVTRAA